MDIKKELSSYFDYKKKIVDIEAEINELHENERLKKKLNELKDNDVVQ